MAQVLETALWWEPIVQSMRKHLFPKEIEDFLWSDKQILKSVGALYHDQKSIESSMENVFRPYLQRPEYEVC